MNKLILSASILCLLAVSVKGYSNGAGQEACSTGAPNHMHNVGQVSRCPYLVDFIAFTPGVPHILNVTSWSGLDTFKGFMLTVFNENSEPVGVFGEKENIKCNGAAATHHDDDVKYSYEIEWVPPKDSHGEVYYIWLTVVRSFSQFWVNCDPVILPSVDALPETTTVSLVTNEAGEPENFTWPPTAEPIIAEQQGEDDEEDKSNKTSTQSSSDSNTTAESSSSESVKADSAISSTTTAASSEKKTTKAAATSSVTRRTSPELFESTTTRANSLALQADQNSNEAQKSTASGLLHNSFPSLTCFLVLSAVAL